MERSDLLFAAGFVGVCAASAIAYVAVNTTGATAAAWLQAIGSIAAIIAAATIASRQSREAAEARRLETQSREDKDRKVAYLLVMRLASLLNDIEIKLNLSKKTISHLANTHSLIRQDIDGVLDVLLLNVTWDESIFARFDLLPTKAAFRAAHLMYSVQRFDRETKKSMLFTARHPHAGSLSELGRKLDVNIANMLSDLSISKAALAPVIDQAPPDA